MTVPWDFDWLPIPETGARVALCPSPGPRERLAEHLRRLRQSRTAGLVTLVEDRELVALGLESMGETLASLGMRWWHLPIPDMGVPGLEFETRWTVAASALHALIAEGQVFALHCHGGLGRTGTIAARLLIEMGYPPEAAMERVRTARPGSIETHAQEMYLRALAGH